VRPTTSKRPNLVMILTDDQDGSVAGVSTKPLVPAYRRKLKVASGPCHNRPVAALCLQGDWHMPKLREHLAQKG